MELHSRRQAARSSTPGQVQSSSIACLQYRPSCLDTLPACCLHEKHVRSDLALGAEASEQEKAGVLRDDAQGALRWCLRKDAWCHKVCPTLPCATLVPSRRPTSVRVCSNCSLLLSRCSAI